MDQGKRNPLKEEVELARAITAVILAVRMEVAETRAQEAYDRIVHGREPRETASA